VNRTFVVLMMGLVAIASISAKPLDEQRKYSPQEIASTKRKALAGDVDAQTKLGVCYLSGKCGFAQDYAEARSWLQKAATMGNPTAQVNLGDVYEMGLGVPVDYALALEWFRKAATRGDAGGSYSLGSMYASGKGVTRDLAEAHSWYEKAANQGDTAAETAVGRDYLYGTGVDQNFESALIWLQRATEKGDFGARSSLVALLIRLGDDSFKKSNFDAANSSYRQALTLSPKQPGLQRTLARSLFNSGQFEGAASQARVALLYDRRDQEARSILADSRARLGSAIDAPAARQQSSVSSSSSVVGSAWSCQWTVVIHGVQTNPDGSQIPIASEPQSEDAQVNFLADGIAVKNGQPWSQYGGPAHWVQQGTTVHIFIPTTLNFDLEGTLSGDSIAGRPVAQPSMAADFARMGHSAGPGGAFSCQRPPPPVPPSYVDTSTSNSTDASISVSKGGRPRFQTRCIRTVQGTLGQMTLTNICSQPVDLKWCYRKHGSGDRYVCQITTYLYQNHTLETPKCYRCSYDVRFATYFSSENLSSSMPSDQEMNAARSPISEPQGTSARNGGNPAGGDSDERRWQLLNPTKNAESVTFEARGRSGESNSDDWSDETPLMSVTLKPGENYVLNCDQWFSLDVKWHLSSAGRTDGLDTFWQSLVCYANNPTWARANNLREYDFPPIM
jgi:TPR repeat protein